MARGSRRVIRSAADEIMENALERAALREALAVERSAPGAQPETFIAAPGTDLAVRRSAPASSDVDESLLISTRRPTAPNYPVEGDPNAEILVQSGADLMRAPALFNKNMQLLAEEPFMSGLSSLPPHKIYEMGVRRGADNLNFIVQDLMPPGRVAETRHWYETANRLAGDLAERYGYPRQAGYGVTAAFSPQTDWNVNVARANRLFDMASDDFAVDRNRALQWARGKRETRSPGVVAALPDAVLQNIMDTPMGELADPQRMARIVLADASRNDPGVPEVLPSGDYGNRISTITWPGAPLMRGALGILEIPSIENISSILSGGGKVPSFYDNIALPDFARLPISTIDTHSSGAPGLFPAGQNDPIAYRAMGLGRPDTRLPVAAGKSDRTGSKGLYGPLSDMHTLAASELGMLPREAQSVTWSGVRDLWGRAGKTSGLKRAIADIWRTSLTPDEARRRIAEILDVPVRRSFMARPSLAD